MSNWQKICILNEYDSSNPYKSIFNLILLARFRLSRTNLISSLIFFAVLYGFFSDLFRSVFLCYCSLLCCHCFAISTLTHTYTVFVTVLTDFPAPPKDPPPDPNPPLKKSSLSNIDDPEKKLPPNPPNPPNPPKPPFPPFLLLPELPLPALRLKKLLKKSSSSWSKLLWEKKSAKRLSASLKLK